MDNCTLATRINYSDCRTALDITVAVVGKVVGVEVGVTQHTNSLLENRVAVSERVVEIDPTKELCYPRLALKWVDGRVTHCVTNTGEEDVRCHIPPNIHLLELRPVVVSSVNSAIIHHYSLCALAPCIKSQRGNHPLFTAISIPPVPVVHADVVATGGEGPIVSAPGAKHDVIALVSVISGGIGGGERGPLDAQNKILGGGSGCFGNIQQNTALLADPYFRALLEAYQYSSSMYQIMRNPPPPQERAVTHWAAQHWTPAVQEQTRLYEERKAHEWKTALERGETPGVSNEPPTSTQTVSISRYIEEETGYEHNREVDSLTLRPQTIIDYRLGPYDNESDDSHETEYYPNATERKPSSERDPREGELYDFEEVSIFSELAPSPIKKRASDTPVASAKRIQQRNMPTKRQVSEQ